jgi:hypothetical protein
LRIRRMHRNPRSRDRQAAPTDLIQDKTLADRIKN